MNIKYILAKSGWRIGLVALSVSLSLSANAACRTGEQISVHETSSTVVDNVARHGSKNGKGSSVDHREFNQLVRDGNNMEADKYRTYRSRLGISSSREASFKNLLRRISEKCHRGNNTFPVRSLHEVLDVNRDGQLNTKDRTDLLAMRKGGGNNGNSNNNSGSSSGNNNSNLKVRIANGSSDQRSRRGKTYGVCCDGSRPTIDGKRTCKWRREGRQLVQYEGPGGKKRLNCPENGNKKAEDCRCSGSGENMHGHNNPHNIDDILKTSNPIYPDYGWPFCVYVDDDMRLKTKKSDRRDKVGTSTARNRNKHACDSFRLY